MDAKYFEGQVFEKIDFTAKTLARGEYDNCKFLNCNMSNSDLSHIKFVECEFIDCNLSMAKITKTGMNDVGFKACKMMGLHFEECSQFLFAVDFDECLMQLSTFYKLPLKKTRFKDCNLKEVDFTECDLSGASFINCDLLGAVFSYTNLEKADFRTSFNYILDPESNKVKKARFSKSGIAGLLSKYNIDIVD